MADTDEIRDGQVELSDGEAPREEESAPMNGHLKWLLPLASFLIGGLMGTLAALNLSASKQDLKEFHRSLHVHEMSDEVHHRREDLRTMIALEIAKALKGFRIELMAEIAQRGGK